MGQSNSSGHPYWSRFWARRTSRRRVVAGAGLGSLGLAALSAVGCGDDDDDDAGGGGTPAGNGGTPSSGSSPATSSGTPVRGGTFRMRTYQQGTLNFDIFASTGRRVHGPASFVYEPLVALKYDADPGSFVVEEALAQTWEQPDDLTYIFNLRQGAKFHNKPPVNSRALVAEDVLYSLRRRMQADSLFYGPMFSGVDTIEASDDHTITIKTKEPFAPFLRYMATYFATIVAPEVENQFGDYSSPDSAIGTGRWLLDSVEPEVRTVYKPNPDYYLEGGPYVDEHQEIVVLDDAAALANFKAGQLDCIGAGYSISGVLADELKSSYPDAVIQQIPPGPAVGTMVLLRSDKPELPFKDVRVRQAISLAIDREAIRQGLLGGNGFLGSSVGPNFGPWSLGIDNLGEGSQFFKRDVERAKSLLADAGYPDGFDTKLSTVPAPPTPVWFFEEAQLIVNNLKDVGIRVELDLQEYAAFIGTTHTGQADEMGITGPGALPDPDSVLYRWYHPTSNTRYGRFDDPELTKMLEDQRREFDESKRREIINDIQRHLAVQQQVVYGVMQTSFEAFQPWIKGLEKVGIEGADPGWGFQHGIAPSHAWIEKA